MPLLGIFHAKQNTSDNSDTNIRQHNKNTCQKIETSEIISLTVKI